jgi:hypothetical protein
METLPKMYLKIGESKFYNRFHPLNASGQCPYRQI